MYLLSDELLFGGICFAFLLVFIVAYRAKGLDTKIVFEFLLFSFGIAGFFGAILFYTGNPSVKIESLGYAPSWSVDKLNVFYQKNKRHMPDFVRKSIPLYSKSATQLSQMPGFPEPFYIHVTTILKSYNSDILEGLDDRNLFRDYFKPRGHEFGDTVVDSNVRVIEKWVKTAKSELSTGDFYYFLRALASIKTIYEGFMITNNGETDLSQVRLIFNAPLSRVTGERQNNIEEAVTDPTPSDLKLNSDKLELTKQDLTRGQSFKIGIYTRENRIVPEEIVPSYTPSARVNRKKAYAVVLAIFIAFSLLGFWLRSKTPRDERVANQKDSGIGVGHEREEENADRSKQPPQPIAQTTGSG